MCYPLLYIPLFILDRYVLICIILFHLLLFFVAQRAWSLVNKKLFTPVFILLLLLSVYPFLIRGHHKLTQASGDYQYQKSFYQQLPQLSFLKDQSIAVYPHAMVEATQLCYYYHCRNFCSWTDKQYQSLKQFNIRFLVSRKDLSVYSFLLIKQKLLLVQETVYIYEIQ
jgi:energy-coupling factor transporter transmembrane protein EcfT